MTKKWVTMQEATELFEVSRSTVNRWREQYVIREARLSRRLPLMMCVEDIAKAELQARKKNPVIR